MPRSDGRDDSQLRPVKIVRGFTRNAPGSVLIHCGDTQVLCTACFERGVPDWKSGSGTGWCTAEYDMLPGSTGTRRSRNRTRIDGRTQEIQRLIGRSLRSVLDLARLGENSILVDCDVLQADGGTRTASITGAYVAVWDAIETALKNEWIAESPLNDSVAAVSVGMIGKRAVLDLNYVEDAAADVDMNVVMTGSGQFVEVQGTGEGSTFTRTQLNRLIALATEGIQQLTEHQVASIKRPLKGPARK